MKDRIKKLIDDSHLTPGRFGIQIGIQQSAVSHILSGRNKPSLDVIQKILSAFPEIAPDWLIFGNGKMYREDSESTVKQKIIVNPTPTNPQMPSLFPEEPKVEPEYKSEIDLNQTYKSEPVFSSKTFHSKEKSVNDESAIETKVTTTSSKTVKKIIIYYSDNTFEEYGKTTE